MTPQVDGSYSLFPAPMKSYLLSVLVILAAAVPGTSLAWFATGAIGLTGISQALLTAFLAMVLSVAFYAGYIALGRSTGIGKK